jgi:hypothetical protein
MGAQDSRRYHRTRPPTFTRAYGSQSSTPETRSPFGGLPYRVAGQVQRQQLSPLLMGLGLGAGPKAQRLQADIASGRDTGPLASAIRQIQQFTPGVVQGAQGIGQQMSAQGQQANQQLQAAIAAAQRDMPQYQQATNQALAADQSALGGAQNLYGQAAAMLPGLQQTAAQGTQGAENALNLAQQYTTGAQMAGGQNAVDLAQRYAQQAASPVSQEDLYQAASRRVMQQIQPGLAARGLEAGGAGAQLQADTQRDLAMQFAQNQAANRQATLSGLTGATGNLGNLQAQGLQGLQGASQGVQQAAAGQASLGQSLLPYLQAVQSGAQNVGSAAQQGAGMLMTGPQLAGQQSEAINQLGQTLMQQYNLPMQASGNLMNLLTAGLSPGIQMTQATAPVTANSSKGYNII